MDYQAFTNDSLYDGIRGVLAGDDALEYWKLDADGVAAAPASSTLNDPLGHDAPKARKIQKADIRFGIGIAFALAMPMLIGIGIYMATMVLLSAS
ncbi:hypothetical protein [Bradyrhizobium sp.]|uniref:hypothetical protein n=1 Tax=Bradyrhizobium sp. TaxID=376 RepID=UPI003C77D44F